MSSMILSVIVAAQSSDGDNIVWGTLVDLGYWLLTVVWGN